jgi:hypothetical protein
MTPTYDIAPTLRPKQIKALNVLMSGGTLAEAAQAAKVTIDGVSAWLYKSRAFQEAYDEQRRALLHEVGHKAPSALAKAAELLGEIFEFGEQEDEKRRPDLAVKVLSAAISKGNNINIIQANNHTDNSQNLTVNGSAPPLDAQQLDPATIGAFVEALRSAALAEQAGRDDTE